MDRFVSTFTNRIDAKGRVSVPANFRTLITRDGFEGVYVHPALGMAALDAGGNRLVEEIDLLLSQFDRFSEAWDTFSSVLYGESEILRPDGEGRIILSERLRDHAAIVDRVTFVGLGHKFQMWEPDRFAAHRADAMARAQERKRALGPRPATGASPTGGERE